MTNKIFSPLKILTLAVVLSFGLSYVYAWTAPTQSPPAGNVSAPINTSATAQTKAGRVGIGVTTPQAPLHTAGSINAPSNSATPNGSIMLGGTGTGVQMSMGVTADVTPQYGWIQPRYTNDNTNYNLVLNPNGGSVGIGTTAPQKKLEIKGDHSSTQARLFSDHYGQGIDGVNTAVMSLWASEPGWTWGGVGIGNNINGSPYYGRVTNTRGGSYIRLLDNTISLRTLNSSGTNTGGIELANGKVTVTDVCTTAGKCLSTAGGAGGACFWTAQTGVYAGGSVFCPAGTYVNGINGPHYHPDTNSFKLYCCPI